MTAFVWAIWINKPIIEKQKSYTGGCAADMVRSWSLFSRRRFHAHGLSISADFADPCLKGNAVVGIQQVFYFTTQIGAYK